MLKIGTKLGISYGVLVALCAVTGLVSYNQTQVVREKVDEVIKVKEPVNSAVYALQNNLTESAFATLGYLASGDSALLAAFQGNRLELGAIQQKFREANDVRVGASDEPEIAQGFLRVQAIAEDQINLRDEESRTMQSLLQILDEIDALLTERIGASVSVKDPIAYRRLQSVLEMKVNVNGITKGLGTFLATGEPQFERKVQQAEKGFEEYYRVYQYVLLSSDEKRWSEELRKLSNRCLEQARSVIALDKTRRRQLAEFLTACRELGTLLNDRVLHRTQYGLSESKAELLRAGDRANASILIALFLSVAFGAGAGYVTTRNITEPLGELSRAMHAIARGNRAEKMTPATSGELRVLGDAFDLMTGKLLRANEELREEVAERRRAEEALRVSEERFRAIFEGAPIGIGLTDADDRLMQTNPALREMLGYGEAELGGCLLAELIEPEHLASMQEAATRDGEVWASRFQSEVPCLRSDGRTAWISLNVSRIHSEGEGPSYSIVMMEDITRRRATEQEIRMLAHTITSLHESVVITDSGDRVLSVNPAFTSTYGYGETECVGRSAKALSLWSEPALVGGLTARTMAQGHWSGELVATRKSGENFPVRVSTSVIRSEDGMPKAIVNISRDITEQKLLEEKLREAERERLAAIRRFAHSVQSAQEEERSRISRELHDDLCQRLSGMKFRVEVLEDELAPADRRSRRRLRDFALELDRTITEVRRISSNLRPSVLDDFGLVIALKMLCKDFERTHGVRTAFQQGSTTSRRVHPSIEIALYRIAQEALSNVAKHAGAKAVTLRLLEENSCLRLTVRDDGKGFDRASSVRAKMPGHGIGLISMRERSELLGGTFEVESETGRGTTITSTLPLGGLACDEEEDADPDRG